MGTLLQSAEVMFVEAPLPAIKGLPADPEMPAGACRASAIEVIKQHPLQPGLGRPIAPPTN